MSDGTEREDSHSTWIVATGDADGASPVRMARAGRGIENMDREFDQLFWQSLGSNAISKAACELTELYLTTRGRTHELRLQRSVGGLKRVRRLRKNPRPNP